MGIKKLFILFIAIVFLISLISAQGSVCCEKTIVKEDGSGGAWCQNDKEENCDTETNCGTENNPETCKVTPTSCDATSYCRPGCCYDSDEGNCLKNTPKKVCEENEGGVWSEVSDCSIPQCELGCCLIGDQAAFVTKTRCKKLSSLYGLSISFRLDLSSELQCITSVRTKKMGACVFEKDFERTCLMITQGDCLDMQIEGTETEFYEGVLCSNPELNTNCGKSKKTTCVEGKDEVYYLDSCGNVANIYDSTKYEDMSYWARIIEIDSLVCGYRESNADSATCGNCDYFYGSTCKKAQVGENPVYGDYICRDLGCTWEGKEYLHGETWCAESDGVSKIMYNEFPEDIMETITKENLPGSRYFRLLCYNGEVIIEPCADYRQEICVEDYAEIGEGEIFRYASCRANRWADCLSQESEKDCNNTDMRDCTWLESYSMCVPLYSPGFDKNVDADTCSIASTKCVTGYERKKYSIFQSRDWEAQSGKECDPDDTTKFKVWLDSRNILCNAIGDCGIANNYQGYEGFYDEADIVSSTSRKDKDKINELLGAGA